jgi:putative membrane protein
MFDRSVPPSLVSVARHPTCKSEEAHREALHEEERMMRKLVIGVAMVAAVAAIPSAGAEEARQEAKPYTRAFLAKAGEMQLAQISLALLVDERAVNKRVRQFAEHMIAVHKKISQEVQELAAEKEVPVPAELSEDHKQKLKELSQLSGHTFDRIYMHYILRDHQMDVQAFEEGMQTLEDADVLHWTYRTLPMLRAHVEEARWIQQSLQTN